MEQLFPNVGQFGLKIVLSTATTWCNYDFLPLVFNPFLFLCNSIFLFFHEGVLIESLSQECAHFVQM